jgi:hypothetical protein
MTWRNRCGIVVIISSMQRDRCTPTGSVTETSLSEPYPRVPWLLPAQTGTPIDRLARIRGRGCSAPAAPNLPLPGPLREWPRRPSSLARDGGDLFNDHSREVRQLCRKSSR